MISFEDCKAYLSPYEKILWSKSDGFVMKGTIPFLIVGIVIIILSLFAFIAYWLAGLFLLFMGIMLTGTMISHLQKKNWVYYHYILTDKRAFVCYSWREDTDSIYYESIDSIEVIKAGRKMYSVVMKSGNRTVEFKYIRGDGSEIEEIKWVLFANTSISEQNESETVKGYYVSAEKTADDVENANIIPENLWTENVKKAIAFMNFNNKLKGMDSDKYVFGFGVYKSKFTVKDLVKAVLLGIGAIIPILLVVYIGYSQGAEIPEGMKIGAACLFAVPILVVLWSYFLNTRKYTYVITEKHFIQYLRKWSSDNCWVNIYLNGRTEHTEDGLFKVCGSHSISGMGDKSGEYPALYFRHFSYDEQRKITSEINNAIAYREQNFEKSFEERLREPHDEF